MATIDKTHSLLFVDRDNHNYMQKL